MALQTFIYILSGVILVGYSAQQLEKYSVASATKFGVSPFLIGSTVIAFGTSAPELLTSFFAALEGKFTMVIGNVIGSNVANISLVFGLTLFALSLKKKNIKSSKNILPNLIILIFSTFLVWIVIAMNPFSFYSSLILLTSLLAVIFYWYKSNEVLNTNEETYKGKFVITKLLASLAILILASWLITRGALEILTGLGVGELFVGYTVLAIGTSIPEIAASFALALKGRYETVVGTLIGSNIFNGLLVLAVPGLLINDSLLSKSTFSLNLVLIKNWDYTHLIPLLSLLLIVTIMFCIYIFSIHKKTRGASLIIALALMSSYLISLALAYK